MTSDPAPGAGPPRSSKPASSSSERARQIKEGSDSSLTRGGTYFLGRYRIVDEIGVGGMASVHLARADGPGGFQKWVAIKRIHRHLAEDETFIQMFLDEARIAARISHPNVSQVFDMGKHQDTYWIAMEYLHGEPLRELMRSLEEGHGAPLKPELAAKIIADAAEGLHAAHELRDKDGKLLNLVHRDVTPHNLFLTYDGAVKVVDFGIAKVTGRQANTRAGTLKGKLAYMSPEQVRGAAVDRRTDIFALGVVLWELTTGRRLFRQESDLETLERVQACVVPPPSSVVEKYPGELEMIVMRALSKDLNRRYSTAREMSRALQQYLMRSGSFVGSDEIGAYVKETLAERYQKREAHLQWAAEVTQTISLEQLQEGAVELEEVSLLTSSSDVQRVPGARPAAGAPPALGTLSTRAAPMRGAPPASGTPSAPASNARLVAQAPVAPPRPATGGLGGPPRPSAAPAPPSSSSLPSYELNTSTTSTGLLEPVEPPSPRGGVVANLSPPAPAQPQQFSPKQTMLGLGPASSPKAEPLPSFGASGGSPLEAKPAPTMHDYSEEDEDAVTRVMGSPLDDPAVPHPVSTVHSPAKKVQPAPLPPQAVVVSPAVMTPEPPRAGPYAQHTPYGAPYGMGGPQQSVPPGYSSMPPMSGGMPGAMGYSGELGRRDASKVWVTLIAAVTTLLALVIVAVVVIKVTDRGQAQAPSPQVAPPLATAVVPGPAAVTTAAPTPLAPTGSAVVEPAAPAKPKDDGPVDLTSLPKEQPRPTAGGAPAPPRITAPAGAPAAPAPAKPPAASAGPGFLTVVCDPACDAVVAGGRNLGPSPVVRAALPPGSHSVTLRGGGKTTSIGVTIVSGQTTARRVKMGS